MTMLKIVTYSAVETYAVGEAIGQECRGGDVWALCGDLGAGKTKLVQGMAHGLGVKVQVNSPTFNILKLYPIHQPLAKRLKITSLCHIDAYRLHSAADLEGLGIKEILEDQKTVTVIEWAEKVKKIWPSRIRVIKIVNLTEQSRHISII